jgi:hypothetical protein
MWISIPFGTHWRKQKKLSTQLKSSNVSGNCTRRETNQASARTINSGFPFMPLVKQGRDTHKNASGFTLNDYSELVDWGGRANRKGKHSSIPLRRTPSYSSASDSNPRVVWHICDVRRRPRTGYARSHQPSQTSREIIGTLLYQRDWSVAAALSIHSSHRTTALTDCDRPKYKSVESWVSCILRHEY